MKKVAIGLILAISSIGITNAQKIVVVNATRQDWSGGVAGHYGANYRISVKMDTSFIKLDSLYFNGQACKLFVNRPGEDNVAYNNTSHSYIISASESHYEENMPMGDDTKEKAISAPLRHYAGAALITYYYKGKKQLLVVKQMQSLPPIDYP